MTKENMKGCGNFDKENPELTRCCGDILFSNEIWLCSKCEKEFKPQNHPELRKAIKSREKSNMNDYKKKYKLLLKDWNIFGKQYSDLQKKYQITLKGSKEKDKILNNFDKRLRFLEEDVKTLIQAVNSLGKNLI